MSCSTVLDKSMLSLFSYLSEEQKVGLVLQAMHQVPSDRFALSQCHSDFANSDLPRCSNYSQYAIEDAASSCLDISTNVTHRLGAQVLLWKAKQSDGMAMFLVTRLQYALTELWRRSPDADADQSQDSGHQETKSLLQMSNVLNFKVKVSA